MSNLRITTVDFETGTIYPRPDYPPKPVGVAIQLPEWPRPKYFGWGHPTKNNATYSEARNYIEKAWSTATPARPLLFHNAAFDLEVARVHFKLKPPPWDCVHDTLFLIFLNDPHAPSQSLKPTAELLLGMRPDERDEVRDWLIDHQPEHEGGGRITVTNADQFISLAPGDLVGRYARGDVERTLKLFKKLYPSIQARNMQEAYDRERRLLPWILEMERTGVRIDLAQLEQDLLFYGGIFERVTDWVCRRLGKSTDSLNLNSGEQLAEALIGAKVATAAGLGVTPTGKLKTSADALAEGVTDKQLCAALRYRSQLKTSLGTFMSPWANVARQTNGLIYTHWNQTKSIDGGTRTGRLSSSPNFQNLPKEFKSVWRSREHREYPVAPIKLPALPFIRDYVIPYARRHVLVDRDYSQQELRILAHFENGRLLDAYNEDPWLDVHDMAQSLIHTITGVLFERPVVKNTAFGLIYGMGVGKLAKKSEVTIEVAQSVKRGYLEALPGLKVMYAEMRRRAKAGEPFYTWGGREYYCEPPKIVNGVIREFDYKMLNALIQGSAADCTKQATINFFETRPSADTLLLLTAHDELLVSTPLGLLNVTMTRLREAMESVVFDVPMLSEGKISKTSWGSLEQYDKKGKVIYGKKGVSKSK